MKTARALLLAATISAGMLSTTSSYAATVVGPVDSINGINGLAFSDNSQTYNLSVSFMSGSYNSVFSNSTPTFENNQTGGLAATLAIIDALNAAHVTNMAGGSSFYVPTAGLNQSGNFGMYMFYPNGVQLWNQGTYVSPSYTANLSFNFAVFTPAPIPVPAAAWLLGSGLLGLVGVARRKAA